MLKLEDIRFPITFHSDGVGTITFGHAHAVGVRDCGEQSALSLEFYIRAHNERAPDDYTFTMAPEQPKPISQGVYQLVMGGEVLEGSYESIVEAEAAAKLAMQVGSAVGIIRNVATVKASIVAEVNYA